MRLRSEARINEPIKQSTNQPTNHSINESINHSINQWITQSLTHSRALIHSITDSYSPSLPHWTVSFYSILNQVCFAAGARWLHTDSLTHTRTHTVSLPPFLIDLFHSILLYALRCVSLRGLGGSTWTSATGHPQLEGPSPCKPPPNHLTTQPPNHLTPMLHHGQSPPIPPCQRSN